jgi:hypothetical protein
MVSRSRILTVRRGSEAEAVAVIERNARTLALVLDRAGAGGAYP